MGFSLTLVDSPASYATGKKYDFNPATGESSWKNPSLTNTAGLAPAAWPARRFGHAGWADAAGRSSSSGPFFGPLFVFGGVGVAASESCGDSGCLRHELRVLYEVHPRRVLHYS